MKAYVTCSASEKKYLDNLPVIKSVLDSKNIESFIFQLGGTPQEIFLRDYSHLKTSDLIIADVSEKSLGVGIEIGISFLLEMWRILLSEGDRTVTKFALGMPNTMLISYKDSIDLRHKLDFVLDKTYSDSLFSFRRSRTNYF